MAANFLTTLEDLKASLIHEKSRFAVFDHLPMLSRLLYSSSAKQMRSAIHAPSETYLGTAISISISHQEHPTAFRATERITIDCILRDRKSSVQSRRSIGFIPSRPQIRMTHDGLARKSNRETGQVCEPLRLSLSSHITASLSS